MSSINTSGGGDTIQRWPEGGSAIEIKKKTSWPEVVGMSIEEAKKTILRDKPDAEIVVLPVGSPVTMDWRPDRVRIFVDTVAQTPTVG